MSATALHRRWMGGRGLLASAAIVLVVLPGVALAKSPEAWLERMHEALSALSYHGEFSYYHGGELSSLQLAHAVVDGTRHERLVHLNGAPREVIRTGDKVTCVLHPGDRLLDLDDSIPAGPFAQAYTRSLEGLPRGYRVSFGPEDRIAGRDTVQVRIEPEAADRYGYRLWLDRETALLLRSELLDTEGRPLEIFQFVRIEIGSTIDPELLREPADEHLVKYDLTFEDAEPEAGERLVHWEASWLPDGFEMAAADVRRAASQREGVANLVFSDGLATFSVFLEPAPGDTTLTHTARHGATVAVMRRVQAELPEPWRVTVVGEVPEETAARIAEHVRPLAAVE